jgi:hypothetical protein
MASHPPSITAFPPPPKLPSLFSQGLAHPASQPTSLPTLSRGPVIAGVNNQVVTDRATIQYAAHPVEMKAAEEARHLAERQEQSGTAVATEIAALRALVQQSEERFAAQSKQMEYLMQRHTAMSDMLLNAANTNNKTAHTVSRSAADTLRTPISVHPKRSALAGRTIAPPPFNPLMQTPVAVPRGVANEAENDEDAVDAVNERVVGVAGMTFNNVLAQVSRFVKPFYGDSNKDKDRTVVQFVQNVESVMATLLVDPRSRWRLSLVTMVLQDGALEWMQRKNQDISDSAARLGIDAGPLLVWDGEIRRAFIQQHLGTDTAELWLSKLEMLVLGSEKTPTPIELDSQFDAIARHVYPTMPADDDENEMLLWTRYKSIISRSKPRLYENIVRSSNRPNTLKGWKAALSSQWLGEEEIKAERQKNAAVSNSSSSGWYGSRGGGRGRGGQYGANRGGGETRTQTATVNAMSNDDSGAAGMEGESFTNEGENDEPQGRLNAANNSRGGRGGGRGGRGRGGGERPPMSAERQKLYDEKKCFRCEQPGHTVAACPQPPTPKQQQGKAKADK